MAKNARDIAGEKAPAAAWYVAAVLALGQLVSVMDRYIIGVLAEPLKQGLKLTDAQLGFIIGPVFVLLYVAFSLPSGRAADLLNRRAFIAAGILVWSAATICCAFAQSYTDLVIARLFVGLGEAALVPSAMSLIADYFPPQTRYRGVSVFTSGFSLGRASAFLGGGALFAYWTANGLMLPHYGLIAPWRGVFIAAGLVGVVVCLMILSIREPNRTVARGDSSIALAFASFLRHWRAYTSLVLAFSFGTVISYAFSAWAVSFSVREHGVSLGAAGIAIGICSLALGPVGSLCGGWIADRLQSRKIAKPYLWVIAGILLLEPIFAYFFWVAPTFPLAMLAYSLQYFVISAIAPQGYGGLQALAPARHLGVLSSGMVMTYTLIGAGLSPFLVGVISDALSAAGARLGETIFVVTCAASVLGLSMVALGLLDRSKADPASAPD